MGNYRRPGRPSTRKKKQGESEDLRLKVPPQLKADLEKKAGKYNQSVAAVVRLILKEGVKQI